MDSHEINHMQRAALNSSNGGVRRRPPTATPYTSSSHTYGTSEEDALLHNYNNDHTSSLSSMHSEEEGYPVLQSYMQRRHRYAQPWYKQPQKLILAATLAWVGSVMYLASLAHAILRTHKQTLHTNMMGSVSMDGSTNNVQSQHNNKYSSSILSSSSSTNKASDEHIRQWLETHGKYNNKYGSSAEMNEDFQQWLQTQNKYGSSSQHEDDADFQQWMKEKGYGATASGEENGVDNEDFQQWLQTQNKYGSSSQHEDDADFQQWMKEKGYGATASGEENGVDNEDFRHWLQTQNKYGASGSSSSSSTVGKGDAWQDYLADLEAQGKFGKADAEINVRFGSSADAIGQEWLEYQKKNKQVKYNANGMYDKSEKSVNNLAKSRAVTDSSQQLQQAVVATTLDNSVSTIDWPLQGLASHASCTPSNGCSPSSNVTVLIVYGPEYHTHISEMAWNVASGVHTAFHSHITHHPSSPLHGHIIYGHTSNITFLDVMDADAIIIGSPVYNGNIHPDVMNWINYWHIDADLSNKFGGAFATAGGLHAGADGTIMSILRSMMVFQMMAVGGDSWTSPFGAVATMYEDPFGDTQRTDYFDSSCYYTEKNGRHGEHLIHPYFLRKAYGLGERITNVTVAWKNSSYVRF